MLPCHMQLHHSHVQRTSSQPHTHARTHARTRKCACAHKIEHTNTYSTCTQTHKLSEKNAWLTDFAEASLADALDELCNLVEI